MKKFKCELCGSEKDTVILTWIDYKGKFVPQMRVCKNHQYKYEIIKKDNGSRYCAVVFESEEK